MSRWDSAQALGGKIMSSSGTEVPIKLTPTTQEDTFISSTQIALDQEPTSLFDTLNEQVEDFETQWQEAQPDVEPTITNPKLPQTTFNSRYSHPMLTTGLIKRRR